MKKVIFHIDLDAFFAGCEMVVNPKLIGKPFVVSGRGKRSVIGCASYPARKYGIKAGNPVFMEIKKYPALIVVPGHYELYDKMSMQFFDFIKKHYSNICQEMSIDECFLDVTNAIKHYHNDPVLMAKHLQANVKKTLGLSTSIGIGPNKFVAKMATDLNKPYGITNCLDIKDYQKLVWPLPIEDMFFVGPPTAKRLRSIGINTIGDLANYSDIKRLEVTLDRMWWDTWQNAQGNGDDFVDTSKNDPKSQSVSHTLLDPTNDITEIERCLWYYAEELQDKLEAYHMAGNRVGVIYKVNNKHYTKLETINKLVYRYQDIYNYAIRLLGANWNQETPIQLLGVTVTNLHRIDKQDNLEKVLEPKRKSTYKKIVDSINKKLGQDVLFIAKDKLK